MKALLILSCLFFLAGQAQAAPQAIELDSNAPDITAPAPDGNVEALKDLFEENGVAIDANANSNFGYWHCTAYPPGSHTWGYDYRDVHYNHAYNGAMQKCEYATGQHCHDIHCHFDGH